MAVGIMAPMATWQEIEHEVPELAAHIRAAMGRSKHKTMATLRKDGSPRISGTEVEFTDGEVWLGSMPGSVKARDLLRDPRIAIHSASDERMEHPGDAKIAGRAVEVTDPVLKERFGGPHGQNFHLFRVDVTEAVLTYVDYDTEQLVIESWREGSGHRVVRRK